MTAILGISALYHDSAAALIIDGEIVAAAQEERFSRRRHDADFPRLAIAYCLREGGLSPDAIDYVGFYDKPLLKFDRLLETYLAFAPSGLRSFLAAMPVWLREKLYVRRQVREGVGGSARRRIVFTEHHESHAASAFFPSPFDEAAVLTIDGVGEWATATLGFGTGNRLTLSHELRFPHSLGLLYSAFTYFCGFTVNSGEYKLMGLAPYGEPVYADLIRSTLIDLKDDGSFRMDMQYFGYCNGLTMTTARFDALFGGPPRRADEPITKREMDLAASIQVVAEEVMLRCARHVHGLTRAKNLCMAGGVALNCVGAGRLLREGPFEQIWIQPAAGDAGGSLGAALFIWHQLLDQPRTPAASDSQRGSLLGPTFSDDEVKRFLATTGAQYRAFPTDESLCDHVAALIADGAVVGWFQGRMEFGPRALGARSILGDARNTAMQSVMNLKVKFRESFRPFAPAVLQDRVADYFTMRPADHSPYMMIVAHVADDKRVARTADACARASGFAALGEIRSQIPAVTHVDFSARVQTVDAARHGRFHRLIEAFDRQTGCPVLVNTSFNVRGEPIVCTPAEAFQCFMATDIDVLVMERHVLLKRDQTQVPTEDRRRYLDRFGKD